MTPNELGDQLKQILPTTMLNDQIHCWVFGEYGKRWEIEAVTYGADGPFLRIKEVEK